MTNTLEEHIYKQYIASFQTAAPFYQNLIIEKICQQKIQECNLQWQQDLPYLVAMIQKQAQSTSILTDWAKQYPRNLVNTARKIALGGGWIE